MGKIKSKLIRRTAKELVGRGVEFANSFEKNKKILKDTMPSKRVRNQMAGFLAKNKKKEESIK